MITRRSLYFSLLLAATLVSAAAVAAQPAPDRLKVPEEITVELFSDFQCPFCAQFATAFREIQKHGVEGTATTVRFRYFPLSFHPDAQLASQAAFAANEQGKFWEMHDLLFANQRALTRADLLGYAQKLRLDLSRFRKDLDSDRGKQIIEADRVEGLKRGVDGTPTFFVNGRGYSGAKSTDQLKEIVRYEQGRIRAMTEVTDAMLSQGPASAPVTIEFFADLQSSVTPPAMQVLNELLRQYPSRVRLQFRNFPLAFHPQATLAHEAAMTAATHGCFWEFVKYILDHQSSLREQELIAQAGRLGLDETKFAELLQQRRYAPRVQADLESGFKRGLHGSPVIFVNGSRIDGVPSLKTLIDDVESEMAAGSKSLARRP